MINKYIPLKKKTVLYVEDDKSLQQNILSVLGNFFDEVLIASDGDEAYTLYIENQNRIDLMITDINMPNTDGITLSKHVREYNKSLPIVIISAYTDTDYLLDSIDLNIIKYITKPFTTKKVMALLDKLLEHFQLDSRILIAKGMELDYEENTLFIRGESFKLTKKENTFLKLLAQHKIVTYDMMYESMWDYDKSPSADAVKSFMRKLQKKLPEGICKNQHGVGYYLDLNVVNEDTV